MKPFNTWAGCDPSKTISSSNKISDTKFEFDMFSESSFSFKFTNDTSWSYEEVKDYGVIEYIKVMVKMRQWNLLLLDGRDSNNIFKVK